MLEAPAEDAIPHSLVEEAFEAHDLRVCWFHGQSSVPLHAEVLVTVKESVTAQLLDQFTALRLVAVAFTGYDHIDLEACRQRRIAVANVPDYATESTVELCFGLIFSLLRHIPLAHQHVRAGGWSWPPGNVLVNKRLGILGTGHIGMRVAEIGRAFRVSRILGFDAVRNPKFVDDFGGRYVLSLATLFLHADIIVIACELTGETKGMVNRKIMRLLRPESILINCARGAIVDQDALSEMLSEGRFRAGLDVYDSEPLPEDHLLRTIPESQLVTVPHMGYKCHESLRWRQDVTLANILAYFAESPQNIVS